MSRNDVACKSDVSRYDCHDFPFQSTVRLMKNSASPSWHFVADPLNIDFVLSLLEELRPHFNAWCESRNFVPPQWPEFDSL